jgi:endonuclease/exonuclease/phosphatase family metal-dependent hydrolase
MVPVDYQRIQPSTRGSIRGWLWRCRGSLAVVLLAALSEVGCATAHNYLDPAGPRYEGRYAPPPATVERARTGPLRVITFNIEYGREVDRAVGLLGENAALRDAEILLLQEMDPAGVERIARGLGLNYVYFPSGVHPFSGRDMGTAILSPWPLEDARKIVLPHAAFGTRLRRAVTTATIVRGTDRVRVYSVHLPAPGAVSYDERQEQVRIILDDAAKTTDAVVVGGDFNSRSVGKWFEKAGYRWLTKSIRGTERRFGIWWSLDHVFARGLGPASGGAASGFVESTGVSDHRVVWVRLQSERDSRVLPPLSISLRSPVANPRDWNRRAVHLRPRPSV